MIHALPGLGADRGMFPSPWPDLPDFAAHDWIRHSGETSLEEVAQSVCAGCGIRDGDVVIGASLGGMVACEISKLRSLKALYLVGSAVHNDEVSRLLATLHPLAAILPVDWLRFSSGKIPLEVAQMFARAETSFVRTMCEAIFRWNGLGESTTRVIRIHGRHDHVIPPPASVDLLLPGGHLISMTHAAECVAFIREDLAR